MPHVPFQEGDPMFVQDPTLGRVTPTLGSIFSRIQRLQPAFPKECGGIEMNRRSRSPICSGPFSPRPLTDPSGTRSPSRSRWSSPIRSARRRSGDFSPALSPLRPRQRAETHGGDDGSLYVSGLAAKVTEEDLRGFFSREGKVAVARIVADPRTQESRGFAFVSYIHPLDSVRAIAHLEGKALKGRIVHIEKAKRGRPRTPTPGEYRGTRTVRDSASFGGARDPPLQDYGRDRCHDMYCRRSPNPYRRSISPYGRDRRGYR